MKTNSIRIDLARRFALVLCSLLQAAYWGYVALNIFKDIDAYRDTMLRYAFLGWFRYALIVLEPTLVITAIILLLLPSTNLGGQFLSFFLFAILFTFSGLAWGAGWIGPCLPLLMAALLTVSCACIFLSDGNARSRYPGSYHHKAVWR